MKNINEVLTKAEPYIISEIKSFFWSINKIEKNSEQFKCLCEKKPELKDAFYILNPNISNANGSIFLGKRGDIILSANFFINTLEKTELDFELELPNIIENHPLKEILNNKFKF